MFRYTCQWFQRVSWKGLFWCPLATSNKTSQVSTCYCRYQNIKERAYQHCVQEIEHGYLTPLVFSAIGGLANEDTAFYKRLASLLTSKWDTPYSAIMAWLMQMPIIFFSFMFNYSLHLGACSTTGHAAKSSLPPIDSVITECYIMLTDWFLFFTFIWNPLLHIMLIYRLFAIKKCNVLTIYVQYYATIATLYIIACVTLKNQKRSTIFIQMI